MLRSIDVFKASSSESFRARGSARSLSVSALTGAVTGSVVGATCTVAGSTGTIFGVGVGIGVCVVFFVVPVVCAASVIVLNAQITRNKRRTAVMHPSWTRLYYELMRLEFRGAVHSTGSRSQSRR